MASYKIIFKPSVEKDLRRLSKSLVARVLEQIEKLKVDPLPRQSVKLAVGQQLYRLRVGEYRIIYAADKAAKRITIHYIRHRREVYRKL
ncbi:MAG: type II toxin-antitoxin system RelE/ParE family toxin [Chloroflexi bacterium]|nr:type II toxin-antitoxin system RelE/ParE family toxin [Chloroflexota bacterium]